MKFRVCVCVRERERESVSFPFSIAMEILIRFAFCCRQQQNFSTHDLNGNKSCVKARLDFESDLDYATWRRQRLEDQKVATLQFDETSGRMKGRASEIVGISWSVAASRSC